MAHTGASAITEFEDSTEDTTSSASSLPSTVDLTEGTSIGETSHIAKGTTGPELNLHQVYSIQLISEGERGERIKFHLQRNKHKQGQEQPLHSQVTSNNHQAAADGKEEESKVTFTTREQLLTTNHHEKQEQPTKKGNELAVAIIKNQTNSPHEREVEAKQTTTRTPSQGRFSLQPASPSSSPSSSSFDAIPDGVTGPPTAVTTIKALESTNAAANTVTLEESTSIATNTASANAQKQFKPTTFESDFSLSLADAEDLFAQFEEEKEKEARAQGKRTGREDNVKTAPGSSSLIPSPAPAVADWLLSSSSPSSSCPSSPTSHSSSLSFKDQGSAPRASRHQEGGRQPLDSLRKSRPNGDVAKDTRRHSSQEASPQEEQDKCQHWTEPTSEPEREKKEQKEAQQKQGQQICLVERHKLRERVKEEERGNSRTCHDGPSGNLVSPSLDNKKDTASLADGPLLATRGEVDASTLSITLPGGREKDNDQGNQGELNNTTRASQLAPAEAGSQGNVLTDQIADSSNEIRDKVAGEGEEEEQPASTETQTREEGERKGKLQLQAGAESSNTQRELGREEVATRLMKRQVRSDGETNASRVTDVSGVSNVTHVSDGVGNLETQNRVTERSNFSRDLKLRQNAHPHHLLRERAEYATGCSFCCCTCPCIDHLDNENLFDRIKHPHSHPHLHRHHLHSEGLMAREEESNTSQIDEGRQSQGESQWQLLEATYKQIQQLASQTSSLASDVQMVKEANGNLLHKILSLKNQIRQDEQEAQVNAIKLTSELEVSFKQLMHNMDAASEGFLKQLSSELANVKEVTEISLNFHREYSHLHEQLQQSIGKITRTINDNALHVCNSNSNLLSQISEKEMRNRVDVVASVESGQLRSQMSMEGILRLLEKVKNDLSEIKFQQDSLVQQVSTCTCHLKCNSVKCTLKNLQGDRFDQNTRSPGRGKEEKLPAALLLPEQITCTHSQSKNCMCHLKKSSKKDMDKEPSKVKKNKKDENGRCHWDAGEEKSGKREVRGNEKADEEVVDSVETSSISITSNSQSSRVLVKSNATSGNLKDPVTLDSSNDIFNGRDRNFSSFKTTTRTAEATAMVQREFTSHQKKEKREKPFTGPDRISKSRQKGFQDTLAGGRRARRAKSLLAQEVTVTASGWMLSGQNERKRDRKKSKAKTLPDSPRDEEEREEKGEKGEKEEKAIASDTRNSLLAKLVAESLGEDTGRMGNAIRGGRVNYISGKSRSSKGQMDSFSAECGKSEASRRKTGNLFAREGQNSSSSDSSNERVSMALHREENESNSCQISTQSTSSSSANTRNSSSSRSASVTSSKNTTDERERRKKKKKNERHRVHLTHEGSRLLYTRKNTRTLVPSLERRRRREYQEGGKKYKNHYTRGEEVEGEEEDESNNSSHVKGYSHINSRCSLRSKVFLSQLLLPVSRAKSNEWPDADLTRFKHKPWTWKTLSQAESNVTRAALRAKLPVPSSSHVTTAARSPCTPAAVVAPVPSPKHPERSLDIKFSSALLLNTIKRTTQLLKEELKQLNQITPKQDEHTSGGHLDACGRINSSHCITASSASPIGRSLLTGLSLPDEDMRAIQYVMATRKDVSKKMIKLPSNSTAVHG